MGVVNAIHLDAYKYSAVAYNLAEGNKLTGRWAEISFAVEDELDQDNPSWFTPILRKYFTLECKSAQYQGENVSANPPVNELGLVVPKEGQLQVGWALRARVPFCRDVNVQMSNGSLAGINDWDVINGVMAVGKDGSKVLSTLAIVVHTQALSLIAWGEGITLEEFSATHEGWHGTIADYIEMIHLTRR